MSGRRYPRVDDLQDFMQEWMRTASPDDVTISIALMKRYASILEQFMVTCLKSYASEKKNIEEDKLVEAFYVELFGREKEAEEIELAYGEMSEAQIIEWLGELF